MIFLKQSNQVLILLIVSRLQEMPALVRSLEQTVDLIYWLVQIKVISIQLMKIVVVTPAPITAGLT